MRPNEHSLEAISIDFATLGAENPLRLRAFQSVKLLEIRPYQLFGQSLENPRLHSVGLPPNLETLKFLSPVSEDEEIVDLLSYTLESKAVLARKLEQIGLVEEDRGLPSKLVE